MKRKLIVGSVLLILIVVFVIFHMPQEIHKTYGVSVETGEIVEKIEIEANLHISKRLFAENKVYGSVTIQGHTYQVTNDLEAGKFVNVGQITQKFKREHYKLSEWYYDKESNKLIRPLSIDISRDLKTLRGTIIRKEETKTTHFKSNA